MAKLTYTIGIDTNYQIDRTHPHYFAKYAKRIEFADKASAEAAFDGIVSEEEAIGQTFSVRLAEWGGRNPERILREVSR